MIQAKAERLPIGWNCVDTVICVNVLDHVHKPEQAMGSIHRILRNGGKLLLAVDLRSKPEQLNGPHPHLLGVEDVRYFYESRRYRLDRFEVIPARMKELDGCLVAVLYKPQESSKREVHSWLSILMCPVCGGNLLEKNDGYFCPACNSEYYQQDGVLVMQPEHLD